LGNETATYTIDQSIEPNASIQIPVTFIVDSNFKEKNLTNTVEIKSSFNSDITDINGNPLALPDWDSKPDDENNEEYISDNEVNESGPGAIDNQDEDDHDIAILQVNNLPAIITINPELCNTLGSVQVEIASNGTPPFNFRLKDANGSIISNTSNSSDAMNNRSIFKIQIPLLADLDGNDNCDNPCPEYLVVPEGEMYGNFKAKEIIEIKGEAKKTKTAVFDICQ